MEDDNEDRRSLGIRRGDRHAGDMHPTRSHSSMLSPNCVDFREMKPHVDCSIIILLQDAADCCSPIGKLNTHPLHANPPVLVSDFALT